MFRAGSLYKRAMGACDSGRPWGNPVGGGERRHDASPEAAAACPGKRSQKGWEMRKGMTYALMTAAVLAMLALALGAAACGGDGATDDAGVTGTAAERAAEILGHEPTGLAKQIVDKGTLVVANDPNYAPQSSVNKDTGKLEGFDVDVANLVGEALGLTVEFKNPNWDSVPTGLQTGRWDVSIGSMTITAERAKTLAFTDPYYYTQGQLMVRQGDPKITEVEQLKGKTIGVGTQTTYNYFLDAVGGVTIKAYATDLDAFPDLENGRLDGVMTADLTASEAISSGKPFELSGKPFYYEPLAFATRQGEDDLTALFNYSIKWMRDNGKLTDAAKKWYHGFDVSQEPESGVPDYEEVMSKLGG